MKLDGHKEIKIEHRQQAKQKQEFKHIGNGRRRRGLTLFAYDTENEEVYAVVIEKRNMIDISRGKKAVFKAVINPKHPHLYALNKKNALRKFKKQFNLK